LVFGGDGILIGDGITAGDAVAAVADGITAGDGITTATGDSAAAAAPVFRFTLHLPVLPQTHSSFASHSGFSFIMEHLLPPNISLIEFVDLTLL
jgi:hypothetical protein